LAATVAHLPAPASLVLTSSTNFSSVVQAMESSGLSPSLEAALRAAIDRIPGVEHVLISNSYGLPVAKVSADGADVDVTPFDTFAIVFAKAAEAADKLPLGKTKSAVTLSPTFVLVQASLAPLVVAVVAKPSVNVGLLNASLPALVAMLEPLRAAAEAG